MDYVTATIVATTLIFVLMAIGTPVFAALGLSGVAGIIMVENLDFVLNRLKSFSYHQSASYLLTVVPLFILMGAFAHHAGVGHRLFSVARKWVGHWPGGLAMASVLTSAGFACTSGSSVATAVFIFGTWVVAKNLKHRQLPVDKASWKERLFSLRDAWQVILLFVAVLGGIYMGLVTPTEAGAVGAFVAFLMLCFSRSARPTLGRSMYQSFRSSATTTVMIMMTIVGAAVFSYFLSLAQVPQAIAGAVVEAPLS